MDGVPCPFGKRSFMAAELVLAVGDGDPILALVCDESKDERGD